LLWTTALSPGHDVRGEQNVFSYRSNRDRAEHGWFAPVETRTFYDGDAGSYKARRKKHGHAIHQARGDKGTMDLAATLDQQGLYLASGQPAQKRRQVDSAIAG
jgi:hypothetical protein